jgi:hypothetical protein
MNFEIYHNEILKHISTLYNIDYEDMKIKVPYKTKVKIEYYDFLGEYSLKSLKELQELAIKYNVSKSGKKEKIIERIYPFLSMREVIQEYKDENNLGSCISKKEDYNEKKEKVDVCVGTDNSLNEIISKTNNNSITEKDLLLLLKTHGLSLDGSKDDLIERLKNFYRETNTKDIIKEHILENIKDDEYVSRVEINDQFMNIISTGISIDIKDKKWERRNNILGETEYILIPIKNWIFRETEASYEFIGIANMDHSYELCDLPNELMEITE